MGADPERIWPRVALITPEPLPLPGGDFCKLAVNLSTSNSLNSLFVSLVSRPWEPSNVFRVAVSFNLLWEPL